LLTHPKKHFFFAETRFFKQPFGAAIFLPEKHFSALAKSVLVAQAAIPSTSLILGIPVDRDRSFRFIVTGDSGLS